MMGVRLPKPDHCESCGTPEAHPAGPMALFDHDRVVLWSRRHQGWLCRQCYLNLSPLRIVDVTPLELHETKINHQKRT